MATEDGEDVQQAEKVGLKRKLTGPPRLLLGKTRTRSVGEDRPEAQTNTDRDEYSLKNSESETTELTEGHDVEEEILPEVKAESSRGRCDDTGEDDGIRNRNLNRRRWWRRFSSVVVCIRRQKKENQQNLEVDTAGRRRFNMRFRISSKVWTQEQKTDAEEPSLTFQNKLRRFFRGGRSRSSDLTLENMEDTTRIKEAPCLPDKLQRDGTNLSPETVAVTAEMDDRSTEDRAAAESPDESPPDVTEDLTADRSDTIQTDSKVVEVAADTHKVPAEDLIEVFSTKVDQDLNDHLPARTVPPEEKTNQAASQPLQPSMNGPSIWIEVVPPDDVSLEDEDEEGDWEGSPSSENQNHLLLLLSFDHREQQLLQTARSLVRVAMNAAVDQLTREQQSGSEPQGCRA